MMPAGTPIAIATSSAPIPSVAETGSVSSMILFTVWLTDLYEGPKFIQRKVRSPPGI